jgi:hypothetical protein
MDLYDFSREATPEQLKVGLKRMVAQFDFLKEHTELLDGTWPTIKKVYKKKVVDHPSFKDAYFYLTRIETAFLRYSAKERYHKKDFFTYAKHLIEKRAPEIGSFLLRVLLLEVDEPKKSERYGKAFHALTALYVLCNVSLALADSLLSMANEDEISDKHLKRLADTVKVLSHVGLISIIEDIMKKGIDKSYSATRPNDIIDTEKENQMNDMFLGLGSLSLLTISITTGLLMMGPRLYTEFQITRGQHIKMRLKQLRLMKIDLEYKRSTGESNPAITKELQEINERIRRLDRKLLTLTGGKR